MEKKINVLVIFEWTLAYFLKQLVNFLLFEMVK